MTSTGEAWRLGRRPALDGLRGVAVLLVVVGHGFPYFAAGGVVGVTVFFVLSGFLITSLLLAEHEDTGGIDLKAFYLRRARRLLPALFVFLAVMLVAGFVLGPVLATPRAVLEAVFYVENLGAASTGVGHTWSLSVEEQFYIVFPVAAIATLARWGRPGLRLLLVAGIAGSAVARWLLWDDANPGRVYHGTDTNAGALLAGCLLAVTMTARPAMTRNHPRMVVAGLACLTVLGLLPDGQLVRQWLQLGVTLLAAGIIWASTAGAAPVRALCGRWLGLVGRRSYGLYLWHFPLLYIIAPRLELAWWGVLVLAGLSWLLALASWRYVEQAFLPRSRVTAGRSS